VPPGGTLRDHHLDEISALCLEREVGDTVRNLAIAGGTFTASVNRNDGSVGKFDLKVTYRVNNTCGAVLENPSRTQDVFGKWGEVTATLARPRATEKGARETDARHGPAKTQPH